MFLVLLGSGTSPQAKQFRIEFQDLGRLNDIVVLRRTESSCSITISCDPWLIAMLTLKMSWYHTSSVRYS